MPVRKVAVGGVAGLVATLGVCFSQESEVVKQFLAPEVSSFLTALLTFVASYMMPPGKGEVIDGES